MSMVKPEVGMGVTLGVGSDRYPGTITRVSKSGKRFWYTRDHMVRTDKNGFSESQTYVYETIEGAPEYEVYLNKKGRWREAGQGSYLGIGHRSGYLDPHF